LLSASSPLANLPGSGRSDLVSGENVAAASVSSPVFDLNRVPSTPTTSATSTSLKPW